MTTISTTGPVPHPRSRLRARLVLAGFAAVGLAALAWAAFVQPLPRLTYNPSDSVAVGWYRIEPFDRAPPRCHVRCPWTASCWCRCPTGPPGCAARLPADRVPLLKRGRSRAATRLHRRRPGSHRRRAGGRRLPADRLGRPLPSLQLCRRLEPGELFLLSVTNPASFDSRYFGPVSASAVIGVAHPVWLETRP
jgi:type IV secretory pathway protease TraF